MAKTYTKIKLVRGSEYDSIGAWKPKGDKAPANLLASTSEFELETNLMPGKYRLSFWKTKEKKTENSPDGAFILEKVEEQQASTPTSTSNASMDFTF